MHGKTLLSKVQAATNEYPKTGSLEHLNKLGMYLH